MQLGQMIGVAASKKSGGVVSLGLTHDWGMGEDLIGPLTDRVGGANLTTSLGQSLDYIPGDYSMETGATDFQLSFLNGKTKATCGFLVRKDANQGKIGPGYYYGRPFCLGLDANHLWRVLTNAAEINWIVNSALCPATGAWMTAVFRLDIPNALWETSFNGSVVANSPSRTPAANETINVPANNHRKLVLGNTSSSSSSWVSSSPIDGKIGRMFITSDLLTLPQAESILRDAPANFPTLSDGHIYLLDTQGATATCKRDGVSTLTHSIAAASNWTSGGAQPANCPQKALGRGLYAGRPGLNFQVGAQASAYASRAAGAYLNNGDSTVECWVRLADSTTYTETLLWIRESGGNNNGFRVFSTSGGVISFLIDGATAQAQSNVLAATHAYGWVHLAAVTTGNNCELFYALPGETAMTSLGTTAIGGPPYSASAVIYVGSDASGNQCRNAEVGRTLVYSRALTAAEIASNHMAMRGDYRG